LAIGRAQCCVAETAAEHGQRSVVEDIPMLLGDDAATPISRTCAAFSQSRKARRLAGNESLGADLGPVVVGDVGGPPVNRVSTCAPSAFSEIGQAARDAVTALIEILEIAEDEGRFGLEWTLTVMRGQHIEANAKGAGPWLKNCRPRVGTRDEIKAKFARNANKFREGLFPRNETMKTGLSRERSLISTLPR